MTSENHPVALLEQEHQVILKVLTAMESKAAGTRPDAPVDSVFWTDVVRFLGDYADGWHHKKEEDLLFPVLAAKDLGCTPVPVMLMEHEEGRRLRGELMAAVAAGDGAAVARSAQAFVNLLRDHIQKEDMVLFQMARQLVPAAEIAAAFEAVEKGEGAAGARELEALAESIVERAG